MCRVYLCRINIPPFVNYNYTVSNFEKVYNYTVLRSFFSRRMNFYNSFNLWLRKNPLCIVSQNNNPFNFLFDPISTKATLGNIVFISPLFCFVSPANLLIIMSKLKLEHSSRTVCQFQNRGFFLNNNFIVISSYSVF